MAILILNLIVILLSMAYRSRIRTWIVDHGMESDYRTFCRIVGETQPEYRMAKRWDRTVKSMPILVLSVFFKNQFIIQMILVSILIYRYESDYLKLRAKTRRLKSQIRYQFPIYLRQIQVLLQNNTVVTTIDLSQHYAPSLFRAEVAYFVEQLRQRPQDIDPYLDFLSFYQLPEIARAMKLLYRYNTVGQADSYHQLNRMIQSTSKWLREERISRKTNAQAAYQWWGMVKKIANNL